MARKDIWEFGAISCGLIVLITLSLFALGIAISWSLIISVVAFVIVSDLALVSIMNATPKAYFYLVVTIAIVFVALVVSIGFYIAFDVGIDHQFGAIPIAYILVRYTGLVVAG